MSTENIKKNNFFTSHKKKNIHLIGIGGIGMSGIASILLKLGHKISGSDLMKNSVIEKLVKLGAIIYSQHSEKNIKNIDFIIKSSAIKSNNKELIAAKKYNIPVFLRAEMLQILMQFKFGISISGTHGKTTTTSMIVDIFTKSQLNPTFINGGFVKSIQASAKLGSSRYFIVEADESDASFLYLNPMISIVTNIESDHMENYENNFEKLKKTFLIFLKKIPLHGTAIVCIDDHNIREIISEAKCKVITYGFNKKADIRIFSYKQHFFHGYFKLIIKNKTKLNITLNLPGRHNALNSAAAVALAIHQGIKKSVIVSSLKNFEGTSRRFEYLGSFEIKKNNNVMLINDYGHHPTELLENIKTIRMSWPSTNLIMIFQPHRYTRTYYLYDDFIHALSQVDTLLILNVYSANEKFIPGSDSLSICKDIQKKGKIHVTLISDYNLILDTLVSRLNGNDIILIQGAGNIDEIVYKILIKKNIKKVIK